MTAHDFPRASRSAPSPGHAAQRLTPGGTRATARGGATFSVFGAAAGAYCAQRSKAGAEAFLND